MSLAPVAPVLRRYAVALVSVAAALALRIALDPWLGYGVPYMTLFAAVVFAAWYGGRGPALLAIATGGIAAATFILPPRGQLKVDSNLYPAGILVFALMATFIAAVTGLMARSRTKAERNAKELDLQTAWLRGVLASITDAVVATDVEGRIRFINPVAAAMVGWTGAEATGQQLSLVLRVLREAGREPLELPNAQKRLAPGSAFASTAILVDRVDRERPIDLTSAPILGATGEVVGDVLVFRDLSARRTAEAHARTTAERLRMALEIGRLGAWEWNLASNELWWSPGLESIHGLAPGVFDGTFGGFTRLIHPDDRPRVERAVADAVRSGGSFEVQFRAPRPDGSPIWITTAGKVLHDAAGRPDRMLGLSRDVTERVRAEEELRSRQQEFHALADGMPLFVFVWSAERRLEYGNERWREWSGLTLEETAQPGTWRLMHPDDRGDVARRWKTALLTGQAFSAGFRIRRPGDPTYRWYVAHTTPFKGQDGQRTRWVTAVVDVDDRVRAEQQVSRLHRISARLNSTLDPDLLLDTLVEEALELVGAEGGGSGLCQEGVMVGRRYLRHGVSEPFEHVWGPMEGLPGWLLVHKAPYVTNEALADPQISADLCRRLGVRSAIATPILDQRGSVLGFFEIHNKKDGTDFTAADRDQLLAVSQSAGIAIQNALAYRRIHEAEAALRHADRQKDEFLATLAHELRNPLAPIRNALEILRSVGPDDPLAERSRAMMERQLAHLVRLLDDLLDVSRITRDRLELRRERIELRSVIDSAVETARPLFETRRHAFSIALPQHPVHLEADSTRLAQVFANLLNNAAKYTDPGGRIELTAEEHGDRVVVTVRDTGMGISAEDQARLFTMFAQGRPPAGGAEAGLGIGLALARRLVELHGGRIEARSEGEGCGSEFKVEMPLARRRPAGQPPARSTAGNELEADQPPVHGE